MEVIKAIAIRLVIEQSNWKGEKSQMVAMVCTSVGGELEKGIKQTAGINAAGTLDFARTLQGHVLRKA